jgi:DNA-binding response OmpR family regulator
MMKVLIAEDDLLIADMTEELLSDNGYDVCGIGRTVTDALALAWRHKPDLAVLDVRLADGGLGTQIAAELSELRDLGILYVTGNVAAVRSDTVRGHACLAKPYRPSDLLRSLQIVSGMIDGGTAIRPFPPNFHLLPAAVALHLSPAPGTLGNSACDDDTARAQTLRWRQSVLAHFGNYVLRQGELALVLIEAVRVCAEGLRTVFCKLHRYRPAKDDLLREAAYGWHSGVAWQVVLCADARSSEGRAFVTRAPVIRNGSRDPSGCNRPGSTTARRTLSTVDVVIKRGDDRPYGVLGASNNAGQSYDQDDVDFLTSVADIVAASVAGFERTAVLNRTIGELLFEVEARNRTPDQQQPQVEQTRPCADDDMPVNGLPRAPTNQAPVNPGTHCDGPKGALDEPRGGAMPRVVSRPILIIEDDVLLCNMLAGHFAVQPGFNVFTAGNLAEADRIRMERGHHFDTIMLDTGLSDGDGCDYCRKLRQEGHEMPIIMLADANDEMDVVRGLDAGANDYVGKPFVWNELFARVRAQLRIYEDHEAAAFSVGPYVFRPARKLLQDVARNRRIQLTRMEAAILKFLYRWGPSVVDRSVLMKEVWGYNAKVTTHTLETHVYRLRQKIEANPAMPALLLSDRGGYRLNSETASP